MKEAPPLVEAGFGLTEQYYQLLRKAAQAKRITEAELIRRAVEKMAFDDGWVRSLRQSKKPNGILTYRRTAHFTPEQFERLACLARFTGLARSEVIRRAVEDFLSSSMFL
ncbi:ribbon-helix-helix domain-containing protein [Calderihabitans maritimus]|uniref:Predicted DNA-binding protein ribbon-helix-helix domain-containing protein n=1 Tax=Calderihabitans maritimus TaxID=1246530 RepID=A0A1Z5HTM4_9FIRM|nr:ribbon-helix-helix domain-containing protein [Calderihabitans maritimus]GAW92874.1 hypothetical protein COPRO5265_0039 [Calderihabitans maritimus]